MLDEGTAGGDAQSEGGPSGHSCSVTPSTAAAEAAMIEGVQLSEQLLLDAAAAADGQGQVRKIIRELCGVKGRSLCWRETGSGKTFRKGTSRGQDQPWCGEQV